MELARSLRRRHRVVRPAAPVHRPAMRPRRAPRRSVLRRFARESFNIILGALFRIRLEGEPPAQGPYILAANHQGWVDGFLLLALFPAAPRLVFLGDSHGVTNRWWKRAVLALFGGVIRIDRSRSADAGAIAAGLACLRSGDVLVVFPEGRVSRREDALAPFHRGIGYLAHKAHVPILPVHLSGTAELYLGRELVVRVGALRHPTGTGAIRAASEALARASRADVAALAPVWREPAVARKRLGWLTNLL